jgi:hypothetical protein
VKFTVELLILLVNMQVQGKQSFMLIIVMECTV